MQPATSRIRLQNAIINEYKDSMIYRELRSERQKLSSIDILNFIASHGFQPVRRCILKEERWPKNKEFTPLNDRELQRILDKLVSDIFIMKSEVIPQSTRGKTRSKPDVFYSLAWSKVNRNDLTIEDRGIYDSIIGPIMSNLSLRQNTSNRASRLGLAMLPYELMKNFQNLGLLETTDSDVAEWADGLPDSEASLREQIKSYIYRKEQSKKPEARLFDHLPD